MALASSYCSIIYLPMPLMFYWYFIANGMRFIHFDVWLTGPNTVFASWWKLWPCLNLSHELLWLSFVDKLTVTVDQIGKICFYILPLFSTMLRWFNGAQNGCTAEWGICSFMCMLWFCVWNMTNICNKSFLLTFAFVLQNPYAESSHLICH